MLLSRACLTLFSFPLPRLGSFAPHLRSHFLVGRVSFRSRARGPLTFLSCLWLASQAARKSLAYVNDLQVGWFIYDLLCSLWVVHVCSARLLMVVWCVDGPTVGFLSRFPSCACVALAVIHAIAMRSWFAVLFALCDAHACGQQATERCPRNMSPTTTTVSLVDVPFFLLAPTAAIITHTRFSFFSSSFSAHVDRCLRAGR
jgi:hypothetical protein